MIKLNLFWCTTSCVYVLRILLHVYTLLSVLVSWLWGGSITLDESWGSIPLGESALLEVEGSVVSLGRSASWEAGGSITFEVEGSVTLVGSASLEVEGPGRPTSLEKSLFLEEESGASWATIRRIVPAVAIKGRFERWWELERGRRREGERGLTFSFCLFLGRPFRYCLFSRLFLCCIEMIRCTSITVCTFVHNIYMTLCTCTSITAYTLVILSNLLSS